MIFLMQLYIKSMICHVSALNDAEIEKNEKNC